MFVSYALHAKWKDQFQLSLACGVLYLANIARLIFTTLKFLILYGKNTSKKAAFSNTDVTILINIWGNTVSTITKNACQMTNVSSFPPSGWITTQHHKSWHVNVMQTGTINKSPDKYWFYFSYYYAISTCNVLVILFNNNCQLITF